MDVESYYQITETYDEYKDISGDVEKFFDTANYDERVRKRPLPVGKNKNVVGLIKYEGGKVTTKFA